MTAVQPRSAWGARPAKPHRAFTPDLLQGVAVHYNGPAVYEAALTDPRKYLRDVQAKHMDVKGWSDIAYNLAVDMTGQAWELRGFTTESGANGDDEVNQHWFAILFIIGAGQWPTEAAIKTARTLIAAARQRYPKALRIVGHKDVRPDPTDCPGVPLYAHVRAGTLEPKAGLPLAVQRGFDVSHYQGATNWAALKSKYGITWGAAKATEGTTALAGGTHDPNRLTAAPAEFGLRYTVRDGTFPTNWKTLAAAGLIRMAYGYGHPNDDPVKEVANFVSYIKAAGPLTPTDLFCLDLETGDGESQAHVNAWAKAWATEFRKQMPGYVPGCYFGKAYAENQTGAGLNDPARYFGWWWFPRYPAAYSGASKWPAGWDSQWLPSPNAWGARPTIWQFSENFPASGEGTDANLFIGSLDELRTLNGDTDMALSDADKKWIKDTVDASTKAVEPWTYKGTGETEDMHGALKKAEAAAAAASQQSATNGAGLSDLKAAVAELRAKVDQLASGGVDADALADRIVADLASRLQQ